MQWLKFVLISLSVSACAPARTPSGTAHVDFAFESYIEMYKMDKKRFLGIEDTRQITIQFQSLNQDGYEGVCYYSSPIRLIQIDPMSWLFGSQDDKIVLFYNEMGHCDLNLHGHTDGQTIMNPYGITGRQYAADREGFLHKLFLEGR